MLPSPPSFPLSGTSPEPRASLGRPAPPARPGARPPHAGTHTLRRPAMFRERPPPSPPAPAAPRPAPPRPAPPARPRLPPAPRLLRTPGGRRRRAGPSAGPGAGGPNGLSREGRPGPRGAPRPGGDARPPPPYLAPGRGDGSGAAPRRVRGRGGGLLPGAGGGLRAAPLLPPGRRHAPLARTALSPARAAGFAPRRSALARGRRGPGRRRGPCNRHERRQGRARKHLRARSRLSPQPPRSQDSAARRLAAARARDRRGHVTPAGTGRRGARGGGGGAYQAGGGGGAGLGPLPRAAGRRRRREARGMRKDGLGFTATVTVTGTCRLGEMAASARKTVHGGWRSARTALWPTVGRALGDPAPARAAQWRGVHLPRRPQDLPDRGKTARYWI